MIFFSEFMVDSGSDVTTIREEVLERLDLELLGTIQSRGVHASRSKRLYKAKLQIGNQELEIEVNRQCMENKLFIYIEKYAKHN